MKKHRTVVPDFSRKAPHPKPTPGAPSVTAPQPPDRTPPAVPKPHSTSQKSGRRGG